MTGALAMPARGVPVLRTIVLFCLAVATALQAFAREPVVHSLESRLEVATEGNFCSDDLRQVHWPDKRPAGIRTWVTLCGSATPDGHAVTSVFRAPAVLALFLTGFITEDSHRLFLEDPSTGSRLEAGASEMPTGTWSLVRFRIPKSWQGRSVRLVATADPAPDHWIGFSEPVTVEEESSGPITLLLLLRTVAYFALLSLPFALAVAVAWRCRVREQPVLLLIGLVAVGCAGYLAFWLWFCSPKLGALYSMALPFLCAVCLWRLARRLPRNERILLLQLSKPWLLALMVALFVLFAGLLYGGAQHPLSASRIRYSHAMPFDNLLPFLFSEQIAHSQPLRPFYTDWLTSDRPPLQTGLTLLLYPFVVTPRETRYQITAVLLQSLWAPALWALLTLLKVPRRLTCLSLVALLFSHFILLNNFFVWPKLLAAAYTLAGSAFLLATRTALGRVQRLSFAAFSGALFSLGLLSHGGSAFALLGFGAVLLLKRFRPRLPTLALAAAVCVLFYLPWTAYQKFCDPPGDRLLKLHLAGVDGPDSRPLRQVLHDAYSKLTWRQIAAVRLDNLYTATAHGSEYWSGLRNFLEQAPRDLFAPQPLAGAAARQLRVLEFFYLSPTLGLLAFGPIFLLAGFFARFRTPVWYAALFCWLYVLATTLIWCLLLFRPFSAKIHLGSYVSVLLAVSGSVLAYWNVSERLTVAVVALQSALSLLINVIYSRGVAAPGALAEGIFDPAALIWLVAAGLLVIFYVQTEQQPE